MKKKIVSLLMVAAMTASLVGCGNSGADDSSSSSSTDNAATTDNSAASTDNNTAAADTNTSTDAAEPAAEASDVEKPEEITILVDGTVFTQPNARDEFMAKLEELIGVKINVIQPDHDAYYDNVGQIVASGDLPDVMILSSTYYAGYASEGVLWDMTETWENSAAEEETGSV